MLSNSRFVVNHNFINFMESRTAGVNGQEFELSFIRRRIINKYHYSDLIEDLKIVFKCFGYIELVDARFPFFYAENIEGSEIDVWKKIEKIEQINTMELPDQGDTGDSLSFRFRVKYCLSNSVEKYLRELVFGEIHFGFYENCLYTNVVLEFKKAFFIEHPWGFGNPFEPTFDNFYLHPEEVEHYRNLLESSIQAMKDVGYTIEKEPFYKLGGL